jgi:hypothetical protein
MVTACFALILLNRLLSFFAVFAAPYYFGNALLTGKREQGGGRQGVHA